MLIGIAALIWIARPVGSGLLLGLLVAFSLQPIHERLRRRWGSRAAALGCTIGSTTVLSLLLAGIGYVLIARGISAIGAAPGLLAPGAPVRLQIERLAGRLTQLSIRPEAVIEKLQQEAVNLGTEAAGLVANLLSLALWTLFTLFFVAITTYFVLRSWERLALAAEEILPIHPRHTRMVFVQLRDVGRHVFLGTISTALAQGTIAGLGYWICGAPQPAFFGVLTAVASLVPAVGTMLVWVPLGVYLILTAHSVAGIILLIYGACVVIGFSDYFLRPYLVGDTEMVPTLLTFVSLFGGIEVFGLLGLVVGPIIVTLAVALLRTYHAEMVAIAAAHQDRTDLPPPSARYPRADERRVIAVAAVTTAAGSAAVAVATTAASPVVPVLPALGSRQLSVNV